MRLIATVGNDSAASLIRDTLRAERIATDTLIDLPGETDYSVIIVARGGENMIITGASQAESVTGRDVDRRVSISSGDALLLQGNLLPDPTLHAAKRAKQAGAKVIFNAAPYRDWCKTMSHDVDVLILNSVEAARWTGTEDLEHAIRALAAPLVVATAGPDGCLMRSGIRRVGPRRLYFCAIAEARGHRQTRGSRSRETKPLQSGSGNRASANRGLQHGKCHLGGSVASLISSTLGLRETVLATSMQTGRNESPNPPWASHVYIIEATLAEYGFEHIADDLARSEVPFVTEKDYESIPDDDPRWEDDSFEPPDRPATFYRCIFGI